MKRTYPGSPDQARRRDPPNGQEAEDLVMEDEYRRLTSDLPQTPDLKDYNRLSQSYVTSAISKWVPREMPPGEVEALRSQSEMRRRALVKVEDEYRSTTEPGIALKKHLFAARVTFWTTYFRLFRISDLPPEILSNIFRFVVWSASEPSIGVRWRLNITAVSRYWRNVALADPTIWNAIWFRDGPNFERSFAWFDRSALAPTDIRINDTAKCKFTGDMMSSLLDRLFAKLSHIRMLIIVVESWEAAWNVLDRLRRAGEKGVDFSFERFELHRTGAPHAERNIESEELKEPLALFGGRPVQSLMYFSLNGLYVDWSTAHLRNLTTLDLRRLPTHRAPTSDQFRQFLRESPGMIKLCLDGAGPQWSAQLLSDKIRPIVLPKLKILILGDLSMIYAIQVLSHVKAPNLVDFTIMNFIGEDYSLFFMFLVNAFPLLKIFTVYTLEIRPLQLQSMVPLIRFIQSAPELRMLKVANLQKIFFDLFLVPMLPAGTTPTNDGPEPERSLLSPKLEVLECQSGDVNLIAHFAAARHRLGKPVSKIYLASSIANKMKSEQLRTITAVSKCMKLDPGSRSPEEILLLHQ